MSSIASLKKWSAAHPAVACSGWSLGIVLFVAFFPFSTVLGVVGSVLSAVLNWADDNTRLYFSAMLFSALFCLCFGFSNKNEKLSPWYVSLGFVFILAMVFTALHLGGYPNESRSANQFLDLVKKRLAFRLEPHELLRACPRGNAWMSVGKTSSVEGAGPRVFLCEPSVLGPVVREHFLSNIDIASMGCPAEKGCPAKLPWEARYDVERNAVAFLRSHQTPEQCQLVVKKLDDRWKKHLSINGKSMGACSLASNDLLVMYPVDEFRR